MSLFARTTNDDGIPGKGGTLTFDTPLAGGPFYVYVGTTGNLEVTCAENGARVTFPNVAPGMFFSMLVEQVHAAATTIDITQLRWGR